MGNTSDYCAGCDEALGLPVGERGPAGDPSFHGMSYVIGGAPYLTTSTTYEEVGRFVFSNTISDPFTAVKNNVWMSGGTGSLRIVDLITSNVIYENTNITSTSSTNIETATGQTIYNAASAIISVQVKTQNAANTLSIGSTIFYYT